MTTLRGYPIQTTPRAPPPVPLEKLKKPSTSPALPPYSSYQTYRGKKTYFHNIRSHTHNMYARAPSQCDSLHNLGPQNMSLLVKKKIIVKERNWQNALLPQVREPKCQDTDTARTGDHHHRINRTRLQTRLHRNSHPKKKFDAPKKDTHITKWLQLVRVYHGFSCAISMNRHDKAMTH